MFGLIAKSKYDALNEAYKGLGKQHFECEKKIANLSGENKSLKRELAAAKDEHEKKQRELDRSNVLAHQEIQDLKKQLRKFNGLVCCITRTKRGRFYISIRDENNKQLVGSAPMSEERAREIKSILFPLAPKPASNLGLTTAIGSRQ